MRQATLFNIDEVPTAVRRSPKGGSGNPIVFHDYESYVAKFQNKEKTTDDTYTPPDVYDAVLHYVDTIYDMKGKTIVATPDKVRVANGLSKIACSVSRQFSAEFARKVEWQRVDEKTGLPVEGDEDITDDAGTTGGKTSEGSGTGTGSGTQPGGSTGGGTGSGSGGGKEKEV